jgi:hypothetical protein
MHMIAISSQNSVLVGNEGSFFQFSHAEFRQEAYRRSGAQAAQLLKCDYALQHLTASPVAPVILRSLS